MTVFNKFRFNLDLRRNPYRKIAIENESKENSYCDMVDFTPSKNISRKNAHFPFGSVWKG